MDSQGRPNDLVYIFEWILMIKNSILKLSNCFKKQAGAIEGCLHRWPFKFLLHMSIQLDDFIIDTFREWDSQFYSVLEIVYLLAVLKYSIYFKVVVSFLSHRIRGPPGTIWNIFGFNVTRPNPRFRTRFLLS